MPQLNGNGQILDDDVEIASVAYEIMVIEDRLTSRTLSGETHTTTGLPSAAGRLWANRFLGLEARKYVLRLEDDRYWEFFPTNDGDINGKVWEIRLSGSPSSGEQIG